VDARERSAIAHAGLVFQNPLNARNVDELIGRLPLHPGDPVLDLGCGKAELLIRLAERHGVHGVGIDHSPYFLAEARDEASRRLVGGRLDLREEDARKAQLEPASFALAAAVGASGIFGGYRQTLRALARLVRPDGLVLFGEGYWRQEPSAGYLAALGAELEELTTFAGTVEAAAAEGLDLVEALESSPRDWEQYERAWAENGERWAASHPEHPERDEFRAWIREGADRFERLGGRETLGFALFLFRKRGPR
jgi:cyclopropane fatty-acyl-phospholipid synthase-like methyltransferase